ncbi:hypothetical protein [Rhizobium sp. G21]|uniref:hypothetical protein n=1 Tax=Rhizobium sp. G21 TaxID=2758439 RepID=UPI001FED8759|nr:hypothetical protein [Rhizobium sp. G21]
MLNAPLLDTDVSSSAEDRFTRRISMGLALFPLLLLASLIATLFSALPAHAEDEACGGRICWRAWKTATPPLTPNCSYRAKRQRTALRASGNSRSRVSSQTGYSAPCI